MQSTGADMGDQQDALDSFVCPITLTVMRDPVVAADGISYEREAIERWLRSHQTSPKTNLRLSTLALFPNQALKQAIEEHNTRSQGARTSLGQRAGPGQEGLRAEDRPYDALDDLPESGVFVYLVRSTACAYFEPHFGPYDFLIEAGTFVVANRREYGAGGVRELGASRTIFARLEDGHYLAENRGLRRVEVNTALQVYRVLRHTGLRKSPTYSRSAMVDCEHPDMVAVVKQGEMVSSTLSFVDPTRQVTFLRPEDSRYWLFAGCVLCGETCLASVAVERPGAAAAPFIYEAKYNLKLRKWPSWNAPLEPHVVISNGTFKKAECRVRAPSGHWYIRVKEAAFHGGLPVSPTNTGAETMKEWTSPPTSYCEGPAGNRIQVCLGLTNYSWLLALDHETRDGISQRLYWQNIPSGLARQLSKTTAKNRIVRRVSFYQHSDTAWYLSTTQQDGSGQNWQCSQDVDLDTFRVRAKVDCVVAFGPKHWLRRILGGGLQFVVAHSSGFTATEGIPADMRQALLESTHPVKSAFLTTSGQWLVLDRGGVRDYRLDRHPDMRREIQRGPRGCGNLCSAALCDGPGNWIVIREHEKTASPALDGRLHTLLEDFYDLHAQKRNESRRTIAAYWDALLG